MKKNPRFVVREFVKTCDELVRSSETFMLFCNWWMTPANKQSPSDGMSLILRERASKIALIFSVSMLRWPSLFSSSCLQINYQIQNLLKHELINLKRGLKSPWNPCFRQILSFFLPIRELEAGALKSRNYTLLVG